MVDYNCKADICSKKRRLKMSTLKWTVGGGVYFIPPNKLVFL